MDNPNSVREFLHSVGKTPLLRAEEEIDLTRKVQEYIEIKNKEAKLEKKLKREVSEDELSKHLNRSKEDIKRTKEKGLRARDRVIRSNILLVASIAKKYTEHGLTFMDLVQEGVIGLIRGIEKYDPSRGFKLSTYVTHWIKQGITRAITEQSRNIRLPVHIYEDTSKIRRATAELNQTLNRKPTDKEISNYLNKENNSKEYNVRKIRFIRKHTQSTISLESRISKGDSEDTNTSTLMDVIDNSNSGSHRGIEDTESYITRTMLYEDIKATFKEHLSEEEARAMWLRYSLTEECSSLDEVAHKMGKTREEVRVLITRATTTLKRSPNYMRLYDYAFD